VHSIVLDSRGEHTGESHLRDKVVQFLSLPPQTSNNAAEERNRKLKERKAQAFTHARSVRKQVSSSEDSDAATPRRITAAEKPSLSEDEVCIVLFFITSHSTLPSLRLRVQSARQKRLRQEIEEVTSSEPDSDDMFWRLPPALMDPQVRDAKLAQLETDGRAARMRASEMRHAAEAVRSVFCLHHSRVTVTASCAGGPEIERYSPGVLSSAVQVLS
jgi:hypothetical protein